MVHAEAQQRYPENHHAPGKPIRPATDARISPNIARSRDFLVSGHHLPSTPPQAKNPQEKPSTRGIKDKARALVLRLNNLPPVFTISAHTVSAHSSGFKYGGKIGEWIRMLTRNTAIVSVIIIAILSVLGFNAYLDHRRVRQLEGVEVREYQGEKLGSITEFRENSIKGPQDVDVDSYMLQVTGLVQSPRNHSYQEVLDGFQRYEKVVTLNCVEGWSVKVL